MCGRFVQFERARRYAELLDGEVTGEAPQPSYNKAPTDCVLAAVRDRDGRIRLGALRWGLIPRWSDGPGHRFSMINARAETVASKPAYRDALRRRRCVIPADGFYEWRQECSGKQPYYFHRRDGEPLWLAGLWERWQRDGQRIDSCTVIVTDANATLREVHDRMPVILDRGATERWLDPDEADPRRLTALLRPCADDLLEGWAVAKGVNSPRNDGADLIAPLAGRQGD